MMIKELFIYIILATLIFSGCESLNEPGSFKDDYSIVFILKAGVDNQKLYIFRTLELSEPIEDYPFGQFDKYFIKNAQIQLTDHANNHLYSNFKIDTLKLSYVSIEGTSYHFYTNSSQLSIAPMTKYELFITIGADELSGSTTLPGTFEITNHNKKEIVYAPDMRPINFHLDWSTSKNASYYEIEFRMAYSDTLEYYDQKYFIYYDFDTPGKSFGPFFHERNFDLVVPTDIDSAQISVTAYNEDAYNHFYLDHDGSGLSNTHGVFGAGVTKQVTLIFKRQK